VYFFNAPFLLGMLLGVVPLIIHLAGRRRARTLSFPSLRFLTQINRALSRRYKLREVILLAMRVAAVCLVAMDSRSRACAASTRRGWANGRRAPCSSSTTRSA